LRIISGERKGHKLKAPKGREVRPTEDRIKESLFNILSPIKIEAVVLDLFSGSGGIGIEFLSRGSKVAYFVDISSDSINVITENLIHTKLRDKSIVLNRDALSALNYFKGKDVKFDYIYLDPPFRNHKLLFQAIESISKSELLSEDGIIIIEHEKGLVLDNGINSFIRYDIRNYGSKFLSFYKNKEVYE
jgi:16S rRNA (guanine(966)-N(2))-methyltransferase RsmD